MKNICVLITLFSGFVASSFAQTTGTSATANSSATIITPISMSSDVDLAFGNIAVNTTAGTVTMTPASPTTRSSTGGVTLPIVTGIYTAAHFNVGGQASSVYSIGLPADGVVTIASSGNIMHVNGFLSSLTNNSGTLNSSGSDNFYVGATLGVNSSQPAGTYTGSFTVLVDYN